MITNETEMAAARELYIKLRDLQVTIIQDQRLSKELRGFAAAGVGGLAEGVRFLNIAYERENNRNENNQ